MFVKVRLIFALLLCSQLWLTMASASDPKVSRTPEQDWGEVLYHFYQQNNETGLMHVALAEEKGIAGKFQQQMQVVKGGMGLSFGLSEQAQAIFTQLADAQDPAVQAKAWYWLTKGFFDSGQFLRANFALDKTLDFARYYEAGESEMLAYINLQLLLANQETAVSKDAFLSQAEALPSQSAYQPYVNYNLGLLQLNQGEGLQATRAFKNALGYVETPSIPKGVWNWFGSWFNKPTSNLSELEKIGLSDRIYLALGYANLQQDKPRQAIANFANIRRHQQDSANALLGYAQAMASKRDAPLALAVWNQISEQHPASIPALQALVSMAWELEKAGDEVQAFSKLELASRQLAQAKSDVTSVLDKLQQSAFLLTLVDINNADTSASDGRYWPVSQSDILHTLLGGPQRQQLSNWLELNNQMAHLRDKQRSLQGFEQLLNERQATVAKRSQRLSQMDFAARTAALQARSDDLQNTISQAQSQRDASYFANDQELALLGRLSKAQYRHDGIVQQRKVSPRYQERLARLEGILQWQLEDRFDALLQSHKKAFSEVKQYLTQAQQQSQALQRKLAVAPDYTAQYARIAQLQQRVDVQLAKTQVLQQQMANQLVLEASQILRRRETHLAYYTQSIALSKLRLLDKDLNTAELDQTLAEEGLSDVE